MTPPLGAKEILRQRPALDFVVDALASRAERMLEDKTEAEALRTRVRARAIDLLDEWSKIAHDLNNQGVALQYQIEAGAAQRLLYEFLNPDLKQLPARHRKFRANRSMRDVEPSVNLRVKTFDNVEVDEAE